MTVIRERARHEIEMTHLRYGYDFLVSTPGKTASAGRNNPLAAWNQKVLGIPAKSAHFSQESTTLAPASVKSSFEFNPYL
jgi:hypothetical protein